MNYDKDFVLNKQKNIAIYIKNKRYVMTVNQKPITIEPEVERFLINYDLMTSLLIYGIPEKKMLFERIIPYQDEGWNKKFLERFIQLHPRMSPNIWLETDEYKPQAKNGQYTFFVFTKQCGQVFNKLCQLGVCPCSMALSAVIVFLYPQPSKISSITGFCITFISIKFIF